MGGEDPEDNYCTATQQEVEGVAKAAKENGVGSGSDYAIAAVLGKLAAENTSATIMARRAFMPLSMAATALQYNANQAVCTTHDRHIHKSDL